ncbi:uncharacterized protein LOC112685099 [Sipha flava]|uniref:Uncharacterized protein LOC112685099 n=1 Tax=Sipha flava TaxID=143950 RepID=A0A8B8FQM8_9HEMI|nr:uncharacterized protein LOC112685099 [Sipha flava]
MTSFGATKICDLTSDGNNFVTTFKIQGQVYHKIGSLMPMPNDDPKFLQIYFMGSCEERVTTRVSPQLRNDNYQIVIKADKVPAGEHAGRFNAPTVDEVAVIMVGDPVNNRDLKIIPFAMTINKSQGQTMSIYGLDLENTCFSHGQLYVACSRVGKPSNLFVLAKDRLTRNVVHKVVLR